MGASNARAWVVRSGSVTTAQASSGATLDVLFWAGVLIVVVVLGGLVMMWLRSRMFRADDQDAASGASGMLEDLRRAHRAGTLSDEQFQRARDRVLSAAQGKPASGRAGHHEVTEDGAVRAKPGFDLTGQPLPGGRSGPGSPPPAPPGPGATAGPTGESE